MAASTAHAEPGPGQLAAARAEIERRLRGGEPCTAADLLAAFPAVAADKTAALELIYTEFVIREELGQRPSADEWYTRFPEWEADLRELFEVNAHLRAAAAGPPPAVWDSAATAPRTAPAADPVAREGGRGGGCGGRR